MGCGERGGGGGGLGCSITPAGRVVLSLNHETEPLGLGYGRAVGNGCGGRWRVEVACGERDGGGGWYGRSITRAGRAVLSLNLETEPPGLSYGRDIGNGCGGRWRV
jgi:hypothetical protein